MNIQGSVNLIVHHVSLDSLRRMVDGVANGFGSEPTVLVWGEFYYYGKRGARIAVRSDGERGDGLSVKRVAITHLELHPNETDPKPFKVYVDGNIKRAEVSLTLV